MCCECKTGKIIQAIIVLLIIILIITLAIIIINCNNMQNQPNINILVAIASTRRQYTSWYSRNKI